MNVMIEFVKNDSITVVSSKSIAVGIDDFWRKM